MKMFHVVEDDSCPSHKRSRYGKEQNAVLNKIFPRVIYKQ